MEWTIQLLQLQHAGDNAQPASQRHDAERWTSWNGASWFPPATPSYCVRAWRMCTAARNGSYLWSGRVNQADIFAG